MKARLVGTGVGSAAGRPLWMAAWMYVAFAACTSLPTTPRFQSDSGSAPGNLPGPGGSGNDASSTSVDRAPGLDTSAAATQDGSAPGADGGGMNPDAAGGGSADVPRPSADGPRSPDGGPGDGGTLPPPAGDAATAPGDAPTVPPGVDAPTVPPGVDAPTLPGADAPNAGVDAPVTPPPDGPPMLMCSVGTHACAGACVSDTSVMSCGRSCTPCPVPAGGSATCDGTICGATCGAGMRLCGESCIPSDQTGNCGCPSGKHACSGFCVDDTSPNSCGTACVPCEAPMGGFATCSNGTCGFSCSPGYSKCGALCIPAGECCTAADCPARTNASVACDASRKCVYTCGQGTHECGISCVSNNDVATCGARCTPCDTPTGGTVSCNGTSCQAACPMGKKICQGACIDEAMACAGGCPQGQRACPDSFCRSNDAMACGAACTACTAPANATPTCDGSACGFTCNMGWKPCGNVCIPTTGCCATGDCVPPLYTPPANATATCDNNVCGFNCNPTFRKCGSVCIPSTGCCAAGDCIPPLYTPPANATATCSNNMCGFNCSQGSKCGSVCIPTGQCCFDTDCSLAPPHAHPICLASHACGFTCDQNYSVCDLRCTADCVIKNDLDKNDVLDCKENLLQNGDFQDTVNQWAGTMGGKFSGGGAIDWNRADVNKICSDLGTSGSANVSNTTISSPTVGTTSGGAFQCVRVSPRTAYYLTGHVFIPDVSTATGALLTIVEFTSSDCSGAPGSSTSSPPVTAKNALARPELGMAPDPGTGSIGVYLLVTKSGFAVGSAMATFDNILLRTN